MCARFQHLQEELYIEHTVYNTRMHIEVKHAFLYLHYRPVDVPWCKADFLNTECDCSRTKLGKQMPSRNTTLISWCQTVQFRICCPKVVFYKQTHTCAKAPTVPVNVGCSGVIKAFLCGGAEPLCLTACVNVLPLRSTHCETAHTGIWNLAETLSEAFIR